MFKVHNHSYVKCSTWNNWKGKTMQDCNKCRKIKGLRSCIDCCKLDLDELYKTLFFKEYRTTGARLQAAHRIICKAYAALRCD